MPMLTLVTATSVQFNRRLPHSGVAGAGGGGGGGQPSTGVLPGAPYIRAASADSTSGTRGGTLQVIAVWEDALIQGDNTATPVGDLLGGYVYVAASAANATPEGYASGLATRDPYNAGALTLTVTATSGAKWVAVTHRNATGEGPASPAVPVTVAA